jgi:hypothetical protein
MQHHDFLYPIVVAYGRGRGVFRVSNARVRRHLKEAKLAAGHAGFENSPLIGFSTFVSTARTPWYAGSIFHNDLLYHKSTLAK